MTPSQRYERCVHQIDNNGRRTKIMHATAAGFIAAAASITDGEMEIALGDGGPHALKQHIALFIAGQYPN